MTDNLAQVFEELVRRMQEPLGLSGWQIKVITGPDGDFTAACSAMPEYHQATISVDPDKLKTGDELDEIVAHELAHCDTWEIAHVADDLVVALCELLPEPYIGPLAKLLKAQVERAEEHSTQRVGENYVRLLRRLWRSEEEVRELRSEVRQLKKAS